MDSGAAPSVLMSKAVDSMEGRVFICCTCATSLHLQVPASGFALFISKRVLSNKEKHKSLKTSNLVAPIKSLNMGCANWKFGHL